MVNGLYRGIKANISIKICGADSRIDNKVLSISAYGVGRCRVNTIRII
jgi:hypothetical protein